MAAAVFKKAICLALIVGLTSAVPTRTGEKEPLKARDRPTPCTSQAVLVGDGSPKQHILHKQVTENMNCGTAAECGAESGTEISTTYEWSIGLTGLKEMEFISAGFAVSETITHSSSYPCTVETGERVCVWYGQGYTEYTVKLQYSGGTCLNVNDDPYTIRAPNDQNKGGPGFYCVTGDACRNIDDRYWQDNVRDGPP
ncbi:hypothetical protein GQ53DRAFT_823358 [Thozetella sp. PMI_491]|nr:hypothetical protein GQ53DRAFT_823358 [Thozetella sp. PMI_491]